MGKQSSRLIYRGTDIKDLYYRGSKLFKLYKGETLVWEKLGERCLPTKNLKAFDLFDNEWQYSSEYTILNLTSNSNCAIAELQIIIDIEGKREIYSYIAISKNLIEWKIVSEIEYNHSDFKGFGKKESGFYVYNRSKVYSVDIEFGLNYQVTEIDLSGYNLQYCGTGGGISDFAYAIYYRSGWRLMQIFQNGIIKDKKLGYPFNISSLDFRVISNSIIVGDENIFFTVEASSSSRGHETIIYKINNMDTDYLATVFRRKGGLGDLSVKIIYDNYQTALFIYELGMTWYAYYRIDALGNFLKIYEKEGDSTKQITLPLYNTEGYRLSYNIDEDSSIPSEITIKFTDVKINIKDGIYPYESLDFYTTSHNDSSSESLYVDNTNYVKKCVICTTRNFNVYYNEGYSIRDKIMKILIFVNNLFWEEDEKNYAVLIDA